MINPIKQVYTKNLINYLDEKNISLYGVHTAVIEMFKKMPDKTADGGNDKHFFTLNYQSNEGQKVKVFVAENEVDGLTVMLPEDY